MRRFFRRLIGSALIVIALALVGAKAWIALEGPYIEALPPYPYCAEAERATRAGELTVAMELAEAGGCVDELANARQGFDRLGARLGRCLSGVWTGVGDDAYGITCAVASDVVVFGDVRDLTRQGVAWLRGEETDEVLAALSAAGIALTFTPQVDAGVALLKAARRVGSLGERLAKSVVRLVRQRAWKPLGGMLTDAGRISLKVGPARATKVLAYADDADELASLVRYVDEVRSPLLGLKWGGKSATRLADAELYSKALVRGAPGLRLAARRGGKALLARQPLLVFAAKSLWKNPEALTALVAFIARRATWPWIGLAAGLLIVIGGAIFGVGRRPGALAAA